MRKLLLLLALACCAATTINAQILRVDELEKYASDYCRGKWEDAAAKLASQLVLDKNNALTYTQVVEAPGKTKEQLYVILNYWYTDTFNDANSVIKLNDKDLGTIIGEGFLRGIAQHTGGANAYTINARPLIKCDIKDEKVRITYTVPYYSVIKMAGGGMIGAFSNSPGTRLDENWTLDTCYPFVAKDKHMKTSSKALIMVHVYSNVVMDKIEECITNGLVGNETEDW